MQDGQQTLVDLTRNLKEGLDLIDANRFFRRDYLTFGYSMLDPCMDRADYRHLIVSSRESLHSDR